MKLLATSIIITLALSMSYAQTDNTSVALDTLETINSETQLILRKSKGEDGSTKLEGITLLVNDIESPPSDTTLVVSKKESKTVYYKNKNGEDIIFTKLPDGGRYESVRTGHSVNMPDQITVLKCIYSNIVYPELAIEGNIEGRFQLEFYLNTSGCIQDVLQYGSARSILVTEAKRAAQECDCEFPVLQNGESKFPTVIILPMKFALQ